MPVTDAELLLLGKERERGERVSSGNCWATSRRTRSDARRREAARRGRTTSSNLTSMPILVPGRSHAAR